MDENVKNKRDKAFYYRELLRIGEISIEKAKKEINPYISIINENAEKLAKKYKIKPRRISFRSFVR